MELTGERKLPLPRVRVWDALNDPAVLKRCLPGCELFERESENLYRVCIAAAVGPIKARFNGRLELSDVRPPQGYDLVFEGSGGAAGFGKGHARVRLTEYGTGGTTLSYVVAAQVGGRLAQVGARLVDGVAKKMADEFFGRFVREVCRDAVMSEVPEVPGVQMPASTPGAVPPAGSSAQPPASPSPAANFPRRDEVATAPPRMTADDRSPARMAGMVMAMVSTIAAAVAVLAASVALYAVR